MNKAVWARVLYDASKMSDDSLRDWCFKAFSTYAVNKAAAVVALHCDDSDVLSSAFRYEDDYELAALLASLCRSRGISLLEDESDA